MNEKQLDFKLKKLFAAITPDVWENISKEFHGLSPEPEVLLPSVKKKRHIWTKTAALMAACAALWFGYYNYFQAAGLVALDVNPSIELTLNRQNKVLSAQAKNKDAKSVLGSMDLKNTSLEVAVNALLGSMLRGGYLKGTDNSILVSVIGEGEQQSESLQVSILNAIEETLAESQVQAVVYHQGIMDSSHDLAEQAALHHVSSGKMALLQKVIEADPSLHLDDLALLPVESIANIAADMGILQSSPITPTLQTEEPLPTTPLPTTPLPTTPLPTTPSPTAPSPTAPSSGTVIPQQTPPETAAPQQPQPVIPYNNHHSHHEGH